MITYARDAKSSTLSLAPLALPQGVQPATPHETLLPCMHAARCLLHARQLPVPGWQASLPLCATSRQQLALLSHASHVATSRSLHHHIAASSLPSPCMAVSPLAQHTNQNSAPSPTQALQHPRPCVTGHLTPASMPSTLEHIACCPPYCCNSHLNTPETTPNTTVAQPPAGYIHHSRTAPEQGQGGRPAGCSARMPDTYFVTYAF